MGESQATLADKYNATFEEYKTLFEQDPQQGVWPGVDNAFSAKHETMVHINLLRLVVSNTVLQKNPDAFKSAGVIENFYIMRQGKFVFATTK